ncbi:RNase H domain-containing protein [Ditylenchus destructor]|uniref:RNase H domain-containing protein n=1 Tax=Ditylenchus destructor TaxID=166010 RepID=A0AAD4MMS9_9BILA|nr:RNase H domain-containing protein [Ditylenchus destructor]
MFLLGNSSFCLAPQELSIDVSHAPEPRVTQKIDINGRTNGEQRVYTDSSQRGDQVSAAIFVERGHQLNLSLILENTDSSTLGEIRAARVALERIRCWPSYRYQHIVLRTDHLNIVQLLKRGPPFKCYYKKDMEHLYNAAESFPKGVTFERVYGHNGNVGNEEADSMARSVLKLPFRSRSRPPGMYPEISKRVRINPAKDWAERFYSTDS